MDYEGVLWVVSVVDLGERGMDEGLRGIRSWCRFGCPSRGLRQYLL